MAGFIPWGLLVNTGTRLRPIQQETPEGDIIVTGYNSQVIQCSIQEYQRRGSGGEEDLEQGIVTHKLFALICNFQASETDTTPTDIRPTDRFTFTQYPQVLETRVEDVHDAAGRGHHIEGKLIWTANTGD